VVKVKWLVAAGGVHGGRVAVRAGVLGGGAVPARRAAAGVRGRARWAAARARARLPRCAAHARLGARARRRRSPARALATHAPQVTYRPCSLSSRFFHLLTARAEYI
jgi:hypothetical protein